MRSASAAGSEPSSRPAAISRARSASQWRTRDHGCGAGGSRRSGSPSSASYASQHSASSRRPLSQREPRRTAEIAPLRRQRRRARRQQFDPHAPAQPIVVALDPDGRRLTSRACPAGRRTGRALIALERRRSRLDASSARCARAPRRLRGGGRRGSSCSDRAARRSRSSCARAKNSTRQPHERAIVPVDRQPRGHGRRRPAASATPASC